MVAFSLERHLLWIRSHTVSWGQQCRWSEQQMALGIGQQPYFPLGSSQQVEPSGHWDRVSGHMTELDKATALLVLWAGIFFARGWVPVGVMQRV